MKTHKTLLSPAAVKNIDLTILYKIVLLITILLFTGYSSAEGVKNNKTKLKGETTHFIVTVLDKKNSQPLQLVNVILERDNTIIAGAVTNPAGKASFSDIEIGTYKIITHYLGYQDYSNIITIDRKNNFYKIEISEKSIELGEVVIQGKKNNTKLSTSIDEIKGRQIFQGETYHAAPISQMTTLIQENLAGAVKATTGEVHIRGQHGEFTYLIDGIPIPLGVFGGLNEIVDPKIISRVTFFTGGFPAEYGGQISGIMDIQTRVPVGRFHLDVSSFLGSYFTSQNSSLGKNVGQFKAMNSNGQSIALSNHSGDLGYFISASRQETDRRIDQPVPALFHDHGFDYFLYGKFDYLLNQNDYLTANLNYSKTQTQVPYNPADGVAADDQISYNSFQTLSYYHTISSEPDRESNLFLGLSAREGGLRYIPNVNDSKAVFYGNDTTNSYQVDQNRNFTTIGLLTKYDNRLSHKFEYAFGFNYSHTNGNENFRFFNLSGNGPLVASDFNGYDFGVFAQTKWHPAEWTNLELGLRYDLHNSPSISNQDQISPRAKWNFLLDEFNTISVSYSRLFMPTNIENLGAVARQLGNNASPTFPEKDNLYEIDYIKNWKNGFNSKLAGFYKESSPGLDDQTLGSSTIKVNVNINKVKVSGIELALTYNDPLIPLSGYINSSIIHAYGTGPVSGGFIAADSSTVPFDLDHDQRISTVIGLNYQPENWFLNLTATYGSGLTNGNPDNISFKTGLFDFNQAAHTTPSWIFNISAGYTFNVGAEQTLEPSLYITNVLDHAHLIKGAFFGSTSFEERRNIIFKLTYHL